MADLYMAIYITPILWCYDKFPGVLLICGPQALWHVRRLYIRIDHRMKILNDNPVSFRVKASREEERALYDRINTDFGNIPIKS